MSLRHGHRDTAVRSTVRSLDAVTEPTFSQRGSLSKRGDRFGRARRIVKERRHQSRRSLNEPELIARASIMLISPRGLKLARRQVRLLW